MKMIWGNWKTDCDASLMSRMLQSGFLFIRGSSGRYKKGKSFNCT